MRAAFLENRCVGTYIIDEREVWLAGAKVSAAFVGLVVVQKHLRGKGIGTAMMNDSFAYSRRRGLALMALHGAPRYYSPFGYVDVFDTSGITFRRADVATLGPSLLDVRTATTGDAGAMAGLYEHGACVLFGLVDPFGSTGGALASPRNRATARAGRTLRYSWSSRRGR